jgi:hypothetical protein
MTEHRSKVQNEQAKNATRKQTDPALPDPSHANTGKSYQGPDNGPRTNPWNGHFDQETRSGCDAGRNLKKT